MSLAIGNVAQRSPRIVRHKRGNLKLFAFNGPVSQENQEKQEEKNQSIYPSIGKLTELEKKSGYMKRFPYSNKPQLIEQCDGKSHL